MIFSSTPHLQIHLGTQHLLLPPLLQSTPLPKAHTNEGQFRCNNTGETRQTHFCFGLEKRKKFPFKQLFCGNLNPRGPWEEVPAGCWVYRSAAECLTERLISSQRSAGKEWRLDALLPSSLDTRVTQWLGWARSLPHSHPLFFALLPPLLSHHYLYCSG